MAYESLRGLPAFLRFLATFPAPDEVARAMMCGPLVEFDTRLVVLVDHDGNGALLPCGWSRRLPDLSAVLPPIAVTADVPLAQAFRDAEPVTINAGAAGLPLLGTLLGAGDPPPPVDPTRSAAEADPAPAAPLTPVDAAVAAPITAQGRSVGAFLAALGHAVELDDGPLLGGLSAALGLWLTHPTRVGRRAEAVGGFTLSSRQSAVLWGLAAGRTAKGIAADHGCSESTIKLEISRLLRLLGASDRHQAVRTARTLGLLDDAGAGVTAGGRAPAASR